MYGIHLRSPTLSNFYSLPNFGVLLRENLFGVLLTMHEIKPQNIHSTRILRAMEEIIGQILFVWE